MLVSYQARLTTRAGPNTTGFEKVAALRAFTVAFRP